MKTRLICLSSQRYKTVSVSRFHVPQGRSKIAQRFIAGLWRQHETSPVRDERTHRSSPIFSVAPTGLWPFSNRNPRLKPWATFGRPYRDSWILALPSFNLSATTALPHAMLRRKHATISVLANLLRLAESRSVRESQRDSVPKPRVARQVARHELPWVIVRQTSPTATRLRPIRSRPRI